MSFALALLMSLWCPGDCSVLMDGDPGGIEFYSVPPDSDIWWRDSDNVWWENSDPDELMRNGDPEEYFTTKGDPEEYFGDPDSPE